MKRSVFVGALSAFAVAVSVFVAVPAMAQQAAPATETSTSSTGGAVAAVRGQEVWTTAGTRIGRVIRANSDGSVRVVVDGGLNNGTARLPAETLSVSGNNLVTTLTRGQVIALVR